MTVPWLSSSGDADPTATSGGHESPKDRTHHLINWNECAQVLYPQRRCATSSSSPSSSSSRFSTLLLEHGEQRIQDWAALAYSQPNHDFSALDDTPSSRRRQAQPFSILYKSVEFVYHEYSIEEPKY